VGGEASPQVDHVIPKSKGGNATIENAQTTCQRCNGSKNNRAYPVNPPPGYEGAWPPPWWSLFGILP
jgi:5-methylcytosine-specific restriction endonuclease McrA